MDNSAYSVIYTIVNKGFSEKVMIAARAAGARGGTIVNARGTGNVEIEKFFGVVIEPEKEIVMILTENQYRHDIMVAIYKETGLTTEGNGLSFSMPVGEVLGKFATAESTEKEKE